MAEIIKRTLGVYKYLYEDLADPRTRSWLLVAKPYEGLTILALYLMFVFKWGPEFMKHRQPFNLNKVLIVYNIGQVICCAHLTYLAITEAWGWRYRWLCEPVDYSYSEHALNMAKIVYYYYIMKYVDLLDTIFFVLRKKFNQVSFLHLYHHISMILLVWGFTTYYPGGHGTLVGLINSVVHCIMYTYYLLTVAAPEIKNSIGLKKFVTQVQIIQFFITIMHSSVVIFTKDCVYPVWAACMVVPGNVYMLILFVEFYIKNYIKKPKQVAHQSMNNVKRDVLKTEQDTDPKMTADERDKKPETDQKKTANERDKRADNFVTSVQNSKPETVLRNLKR